MDNSGLQPYALFLFLFLVEKSLRNINCLLVCPHYTNWSKSDVTQEGLFIIKLNQG